jgi:hypothetical protein
MLIVLAAALIWLLGFSGIARRRQQADRERIAE